MAESTQDIATMGIFDGQRVLVTGAGGFIGSHLTERLVREGASVRAFLRYNSQSRTGWLEDSPPEIQGAIETAWGDLKDHESVEAAVRGMETVFHLGALIAIPYSYQNPIDFVQTNIQGTAHVLMACHKHNVRRLIHTSTSEVYGTAQTVPIIEDHPKVGQSPYAASKIAADALVESFARSYDLPAVIVRPFNTYGPRQSRRAVIPTIITQALAGDTIRLGATTPTRDFLYVDDTAAGFLAAARAELSTIQGCHIQLGTGVETAIGDVVSRVGGVLGKHLTVQTEERRLRPESSEVERLLADPSRARESLGWQSAVSFQDGLARTIKWSRAHPQAEVEQYAI